MSSISTIIKDVPEFITIPIVSPFTVKVTDGSLWVPVQMRGKRGVRMTERKRWRR